MLARYLLFLLAFCPAVALQAQSDVAAKPIIGLRDNRPRNFALQHATVIAEPGKAIADATVLIAGTSITAVGDSVAVPAGFMAIDCTDKLVYAGFIDAWSETKVPRPDSEAGHWNANVTPHRSAASIAESSTAAAEQLRSQGITARLIAPQGGIIKGSSCLILLGDESAGRTLLKDQVWQHLQLSVPRDADQPRGYPNSPMGAVALLRQSMYDAKWYRDVWSAYRSDTTLPRPETNVALDALAMAIGTSAFCVDAPNERMAIRAAAVADEFSLPLIIRGSGREYRRIQQIAKLNRPVLVPVNFPSPPDVSTGELARDTTLQELMHWDLAPQNPARLSQAGVSICLTTDGLKDPKDFLQQVRQATQRGLGRDQALAALTTTPAALTGIDGQAGRVQTGMLANLVITDGDLFDPQTKVLETWVAGQQFVVESDTDEVLSPWIGHWQCQTTGLEFVLQLSDQKGKLQGQVRATSTAEQSTSLTSVVFLRDRLTGNLELNKLDPEYPAGVCQLSLQFIKSGDGTRHFASLTLPDGNTQPITISPTEIEANDVTNDEGAADEDDAANEDDPAESTADPAGDEEADASREPADQQQFAETPALFPLGAYGLEHPIVDQPVVIFRGGTVWTCGDAGVLQDTDVLIRDGLIAEIGPGLAVPEGCQIIDARGKHLSPGLIDCHSHIATDGGINEFGQAVSAEVRIGDFIDNSSISIYRQLAGGTTAANILHGSANPIGGQNQVIKFRWGDTMDALKMKEAPAGIKFALGENVKRRTDRYPNSRMGVEQIIRDQLLAAREYQRRHKRWRDGSRDTLPPRRDLQLDAMSEVQNGDRWIHCHSYRQDEIVALLDVLDEFGIQIGTLQHILEGYKVADRMAAHGAMGSSFSDWWAYKFEVFDAIPYNGALMHRQGIVVSFNSDDSELGRRMNVEAAKATKYGDLPEVEALKFVTLNPAKQLRIEAYVGSLEVGKHADLVVWSGRPLSTLTRCEQTWIDGRQYFSLESERQLRARDRSLRAQLIQKVLASDEQPKPQREETDEEDRWYRHDIFCGARGGSEYDQRSSQ